MRPTTSMPIAIQSSSSYENRANVWLNFKAASIGGSDSPGSPLSLNSSFSSTCAFEGAHRAAPCGAPTDEEILNYLTPSGHSHPTQGSTRSSETQKGSIFDSVVWLNTPTSSVGPEHEPNHDGARYNDVWSLVSLYDAEWPTSVCPRSEQELSSSFFSKLQVQDL